MKRAQLLKLFVASAGLGLIIGMTTDLFIRAIRFGSHVLLSNWTVGTAGRAWAVVGLSAAAGLAMGMCVKFFGTNDDGIGFDAVLAAVKQDGGLGLAQIKRIVLNTYPGLVTGASIGPESPLVTIAGYCGNLFAKLLKASRQQLMAFITIALGGGIGVLVDSPVAGPILFAEQPPTVDKSANLMLVFTSMIAASIGFAVYKFLGAPLLTGDKLVPAYGGLQAIHLLYGLAVGLLGTAFGLFFKFLILFVRRSLRRFAHHPISKGLGVGLVVGVCGAIAPLVMFDGSAQLASLVDNASKYSLLALLGLALLRLISTSTALGGGYQGGNIFPSIFMSGALGLAVHAMLPFIPAPVAMVSFMASVMYVFTPLPLFCIFLFTEISSFTLIPVMAMALVSGYLLNIILKTLRHQP
ncbi:MAG TPA: chloride channel protein [Candidatus Saccharimonadia bacterium]